MNRICMLLCALLFTLHLSGAEAGSIWVVDGLVHNVTLNGKVGAVIGPEMIEDMKLSLSDGRIPLVVWLGPSEKQVEFKLVKIKKENLKSIKEVTIADLAYDPNATGLQQLKVSLQKISRDPGDLVRRRRAMSRAIGAAIDKLGGFSYMVDVCESLDRPYYRSVESSWDGIGDFRG